MPSRPTVKGNTFGMSAWPIPGDNAAVATELTRIEATDDNTTPSDDDTIDLGIDSHLIAHAAEFRLQIRL